MVQHYDSRRKPIYKHAPWYQKNTRTLVIAGWGVGLAFFFGPWLHSIFWPSRAVRMNSVDPRNAQDLKKLKEKLIQREKEMTANPYGDIF